MGGRFIFGVGAALLLGGGCGSGAGATKPPAAPVAAITPAQAVTVDASDDSEPSEEQIAAIEFSVNQLDEGVQMCWAAAAANDGYELAGRLRARIDIRPSEATAEIVENGTSNAELASCAMQLLQRFRWAAPLHGQTIELPFEFRAPGRQYVIDRRLIAAHIPPRATAATSPAISVLLDEQNAGAVEASLLHLRLPANLSTGRRIAPRNETWLFLGAGIVADGSRRVSVRAGDALTLPKDAVRSIEAGTGELNALVLTTPGGRESSARAGALATPLASEISPASARNPLSGLRTFVPETTSLVAGSAAMPVASMQVPVGVVQGVAFSALFLYVTAGSAVLTVEGDGVAIAIDEHAVVHLPAKARYQLQVTALLQGYAFQALPANAPSAKPQRSSRK